MLKNTYFNFDKYLQKVRSKGRYSITLSELQKNSNLSYKAIQQTIFRAKKNKKIAQIRQGFYVIIPPEYSNSGILPIYLYIDDLMQFLKRDYYLGLFSAAILHGAGHQQTMNTQIITQNPTLRNIKNKKIEINFYIKKQWNSNDIVRKKTNAGYIKVSTPELTAYDLIFYHKKVGGINRTLPILEELCEEISAKKLFETAKQYKSNTTTQRLGYILDNILYEKKLADKLYFTIENVKTNKILLSSASSRKGKIDKKWNIIINTDTDF